MKRSYYDDPIRDEKFKQYLIKHAQKWKDKHGELNDLEDPTLPILFNHVNWDYLDEILPELYEFQINQTEEWIPEICYSNEIVYTEENYEYIEAIWDYFRSEEWVKTFPKWRHARKGTYDEMYYFLQRHPEWKDLVYYDENSPKPEVY